MGTNKLSVSLTFVSRVDLNMKECSDTTTDRRHVDPGLVTPARSDLGLIKSGSRRGKKRDKDDS